MELTGNELKCEAVARTIMVTSRGANEIPRTFAAVCPFADSDCEDHKVSIYFVYAPGMGVICRAFKEIQHIYVPDSVRELCEDCFNGCSGLRRVTFGSSSSLERIGDSCFRCSGLEEVSIPDSVRDLGKSCFGLCTRLHRVTFGSSSSLERIGINAFETKVFGADGCYWSCQLVEITIPDSVRELSRGCFAACASLRYVRFGSSSRLEKIGAEAFKAHGGLRVFVESRIVEIHIPDSVRELSDSCFKGCRNLRRVIFGPSSSLARIGVEAFGPERCGSFRAVTCGLVEIAIPDSVRELGNGCFKGCRNLRRVIFGPSSSLVRIGVEAFASAATDFGETSPCGLVEISIPDSVCTLGDRCFKGCSDLRRVTFGSSSSLEQIGADCFANTCVEEFMIPDCVRARIGDVCFSPSGHAGLETPPPVSGGNSGIIVEYHGKTIQIDCALTDKVLDLAMKIREKSGCLVSPASLWFESRCIGHRNCALQDYRIQAGSTVMIRMP